MSTVTIEKFFTGKNLVIPSYQRDYAWKESNVDDLFEDICEAREMGGSHYLGTFILSQKNRNAPVHVVDGQQRLTTLTMVMDVLIDAVADVEIKRHYRNTFIEHPVTGAKFKVLGQNEAFFEQLLADKDPVPDSDGQERLKRAYQWIQQRVQAMLGAGGQPLINEMLLCLSRMEVLEFIETDEGKAIRMFQTVNDRGVPLAKMDIVKSLLVYYSNRFLDGELDERISQKFGEAFRSFSRVKRLAAEPGYKVQHIDRASFSEDDVLRYHYFAFDGRPFDLSTGADYSATSETVLSVFLKPGLKRLRNDKNTLRDFILAYTEDLAIFFRGLEELIEQTRTQRAAYLLFVVQDVAAVLYPLIIRLHLMGWLSKSPPEVDARTLLEILEMVDLRVFKIRGTNPQADIFRITRELPRSTIEKVATELQYFSQRFMSDAAISTRLTDEDMYQKPGLNRILLEEEELARLALRLQPLSVEELSNFNKSTLTAEHILPKEPNFNIQAYGFDDKEHYDLCKNRLGNLVLLEKSVNSACHNRTVEEKMSAPSMYFSSKLKAVGSLAARFGYESPAYQNKDIKDRSVALTNMVMARWPIIQPETQPLNDTDAPSAPAQPGALAQPQEM